VKNLKKIEHSLLIVLVFFAATIICNTSANSPDKIHTYKYIPIPNDLTVEISSPLEAYPNQTINVNITIKATVSLSINHVLIKLYSFNDSKFYDFTYIDEAYELSSGESWNKTCNIRINEQASNVVYGKLTLEWAKIGTAEWETIGKEPTFIMTFLKNPKLEELESKVPELEKENTELKENLTDLNNTLNEFRENLTDVEDQYEGELGGTRSVITILAITTVFFAATTTYLFMRKPKQYW